MQSKSTQPKNYCTKFMYFAGGMFFILVILQVALHHELATKQENKKKLRHPALPEALPKNATMDAEGFPVGYNPNAFSNAFSILNNGNQNVGIAIYAISDGKVILDAGSNLDVGCISRYHLPWALETALVFKIWLDGDEIADNIPNAQYCLCDSSMEEYVAVNGQKPRALLKPSNAPFGAVYQKYCHPLSLFAQESTGKHPVQLALMAPENP